MGLSPEIDCPYEKLSNLLDLNDVIPQRLYGNRSGWHDKTHESRVYFTTKMISVDKNVKEGFKWFGRGERKNDSPSYRTHF